MDQTYTKEDIVGLLPVPTNATESFYRNAVLDALGLPHDSNLANEEIPGREEHDFPAPTSPVEPNIGGGAEAVGVLGSESNPIGGPADNTTPQGPVAEESDVQEDGTPDTTDTLTV